MKTISPLLLIFLATTVFGQQKITFNCDDVQPSKQLIPTESYQKAVERFTGDKVEAFHQEKKDERLVAARFHPFMFALHTAYREHYPLSISPDMIWLLIAQGMGQHVNNHSGDLRSQFVKFEGKKKISIDTRLYGTFEKGNSASPWDKLTPVFSDSIQNYTQNDFYKTIVTEYSTTTATINTAYEITLMNSMKAYFDYEVRTMCGIPEITLEGTTADWKKLLKNAKTLKKYDVNPWIKELEPILKEFVAASEGKADIDFWKEIYKLRGGSGGPYISGWIIKFFPYVGQQADRENPYLHEEPKGAFAGLTSSMLTSGVAEAPFKWLYYNEKYDMAFTAGFIGVKQDPATLTLRPEIGWFVKEVKKVVAKD